MLKLGIIKEEKIPVDRRVPLIPQQAAKIQELYPEVAVYCQKSDIRCFSNQEYEKAGIRVVEDITHCDILLGVKEVPIKSLVPEKTYFFFSHTIKKQPYNRNLLREVMRKKIRLIDYECLTDENGTRVIAFGRYAGIVGAYNGILTYGKKYKLFELRRAHECFDLEDLKKEFDKVVLPPVRIVLTGGGRVAKGAMEVLDGMKIKKVNPADFLLHEYKEPVYTQLNSVDYHLKKDGSQFILEDFYAHPKHYISDFQKYTRKSDLLIAAAYWDPKAPVLFTKEEMKKDDFRIKVIADITCDIEGSIPSTKKASTIEAPVYDYDPETDALCPAFSDKKFVSVMAVDNLPCELPRDASKDFGKELLNNVLYNALREDRGKMIKRATITEKGALTQLFSYLQDYVGQKGNFLS